MDEAPLPTTPAQLFARLESLGIPYELHHHDPVFTVAESAHLTSIIPGTHCRNLFLRDKAERMFLLTVPDHTPVDLKKLPMLINSGRLSFGSPERLWRTLGVRPGSVCPFAIVNDTAQSVTLILDKTMMEAPRINVHPLENHMTIGLAPEGLLKLVESTGHTPHIVDLNQQGDL